MKLGIETFSYHLQMDTGQMDAFGFVDAARKLGLDGVQINIGPGRGTYGHLGSVDPGHLRELREEVVRNAMFIEIDTRGTDPEFITRTLRLCSDLGADVLRLYAPPEDDLDAALDKVATANVLSACSQQPTTRLEAITTYALATHAMTTGDGNGDYTVANGDINGRKVTVAQQSSVTVTATGTANHVALCDATNLLYVTTCTSQVLSATGNTITFPAWDIEIADPS